MPTPATPRLPTLNLFTLERLAIEDACAGADSLVEAASHLGITRHALKRRMIKHNVRRTWPLTPTAKAQAKAARSPA